MKLHVIRTDFMNTKAWDMSYLAHLNPAHLPHGSTACSIRIDSHQIDEGHVADSQVRGGNVAVQIASTKTMVNDAAWRTKRIASSDCKKYSSSCVRVRSACACAYSDRAAHCALKSKDKDLKKKRWRQIIIINTLFFYCAILSEVISILIRSAVDMVKLS